MTNRQVGGVASTILLAGSKFKNGVEDLEKAKHYIEMLIDNHKSSGIGSVKEPASTV